ncbi:MAG: P-loop NTPase, partial [Candidatus Brocadiae bacterium]|nr:P-loop NTPase [Candidatus Brocadiia bacterium]
MSDLPEFFRILSTQIDEGQFFAGKKPYIDGGFVGELRKQGHVHEDELQGYEEEAQKIKAKLCSLVGNSAAEKNVRRKAAEAVSVFLYYVHNEKLRKSWIDDCEQWRIFEPGSDVLPKEVRETILSELTLTQMSWDIGTRRAQVGASLQKLAKADEAHRVPLLGDYFDGTEGTDWDFLQQCVMRGKTQETQKSRRARVISFHSIKGGVGKSTLALAATYYLAREKGLEVGLLDLDVAGTNLKLLLRNDIKLPSEPDPVHPDFQGLWYRGGKMDDTVGAEEIRSKFIWPFREEDWGKAWVCLLPLNAIWRSEISIDLTNGTNGIRQRLATILDALRSTCDVLIIDNGPGLLYHNVNLMRYLLETDGESVIIIVGNCCGADVAMNAYNMPWDLQIVVPGKRIVWVANMAPAMEGGFGERTAKLVQWFERLDFP